ncbi:MAG TPA: thioredoxin-dependent thiol peroxidase [Fimbriimonadaceae bacterium]|nr:thioredoxin-dependent thiol peroxidase [Fimbriimonadaceae bacterium]
MIEEGHPFPAFTLEDQDGVTHTEAELQGKTVVVYFYPKDDTSGCTVEACGFRDELSQFKGVPVLGVSPDSAKSHRKFADKYQLNFPLLADVEQKLATACGIWVEKSMYGKKYMGIERTTYLVDNGTVVRVWRKVKPDGHVSEVLAALA